MLSYEKGCEVLMMKVRQQLITAGFNVRLGGGDNLHEVMRKDVEGAAAVVVAFTRKYKQEPQTFAGNFTSAKTGFVLCILSPVSPSSIQERKNSRIRETCSREGFAPWRPQPHDTSSFRVFF